MRVIHILTALLLFSLFAVMLYQVADDELLRLSPGLDYTSNSNNASQLFTGSAENKGVDVLGKLGESVSDIADSAPGGIDSQIASSDAATSEEALAQGGVSTVVSAGKMLYTIPKMVFTSITGFLQIDSRFGAIAATLLIALVAFILVSSILKNRL